MPRKHEEPRSQLRAKRACPLGRGAPRKTEGQREAKTSEAKLTVACPAGCDPKTHRRDAADAGIGLFALSRSACSASALTRCSFPERAARSFGFEPRPPGEAPKVLGRGSPLAWESGFSLPISLGLFALSGSARSPFPRAASPLGAEAAADAENRLLAFSGSALRRPPTIESRSALRPQQARASRMQKGVSGKMRVPEGKRFPSGTHRKPRTPYSLARNASPSFS